MRLARGFAQVGVLGFVLASLAVSLPGAAAAERGHRRNHKRYHHGHRTEYVLHLQPAYHESYRPVRCAPVRTMAPQAPGYYYDRDCDRRFSSFDVYLEHAHRHDHTRLVFVVTSERPASRGGSSWGGWMRVDW